MACAGGYHTCFLDVSGTLFMCGKSCQTHPGCQPVEPWQTYNAEGHKADEGVSGVLSVLASVRGRIFSVGGGGSGPGGGSLDEKLAHFGMRALDFEVERDVTARLPRSRAAPVTMFDCGRSGTVLATLDGSMYRVGDARNTPAHRFLYAPSEEDPPEVRASWPVMQLGGDTPGKRLPIVWASTAAEDAAVHLLMRYELVSVAASEQSSFALLGCGAVVMWKGRAKEGPTLMRVGPEADTPHTLFPKMRRLVVGASTVHAQDEHGEWFVGTASSFHLKREGALPRNALHVGQGLSHCTYVLEDERTIFSYGSNQDGQLRVVPHTTARADRKVHHDVSAHFGGARILHVSSGFRHSMAVDERGSVHCWGLDDYDQTGGEGHAEDTTYGVAPGRRPRTLRTEYHPPVCTTIPGERVLFVSGGRDHSLALTESGKLYGWGRNTHAQLGQGESNTRCIATPVLIATNVAVRPASEQRVCQEWTPQRHRLFLPAFQAAVHTLLCVQMYAWSAHDPTEVSERALALSQLPADLLHLIFATLARELVWNRVQLRPSSGATRASNATTARGTGNTSASEAKRSGGDDGKPPKHCTVG